VPLPDELLGDEDPPNRLCGSESEPELLPSLEPWLDVELVELDEELFEPDELATVTRPDDADAVVVAWLGVTASISTTSPQLATAAPAITARRVVAIRSRIACRRRMA
jgi:hypothetical protein